MTKKMLQLFAQAQDRRLRDAHAAAKKAITDLDKNVRMLERRSDLFPAEKAERIGKLRDEAQRAIRAARDEMTALVAEGKKVVRSAPDMPGPEAVARRAYYAQRAASELAGVDAGTALAIVQRMVDGGDAEAAQEYALAARPIAARGGRSGELARLERAVEPAEAKVKRAMGAAMDTLDFQVAWFDGHLDDAMERAGQLPQAVREGREPEQPMDTRRVDLWLTGTQTKMVEAFDQSFEADGGEG